MKIRKAFVMSVNPDQIEEYTSRHNPIWPELEETLKTHGVLNYSIFHLAQTNQLFAYAEIDSEEKWNDIAKTDVCQRWWHHMGDIMPSNPDASPVAADLTEVFHIEK
jgi:L-rhamnose mutarotase